VVKIQLKNLQQKPMAQSLSNHLKPAELSTNTFVRRFLV